VIRALEVCIKTGEPFSKLRTKKPPDYDILQIGLRMDRDALYARADARVDRMIAAGLEDEVRALRESGVDWRQSAMSAVGYRQWQPYFEGTASRDEVIEEIKNQTHSFIRRQETWFRGHDGGAIRWIDVEPGHFESTARAVEKRVRVWLTSAE
jgi:tRNA dimethylallyltransferase